MDGAEPLAGDEQAPAAGGGPAARAVRIEVRGLELQTHHGVSEAEREVGQRLRLDVLLELEEARATTTDRLEDTIDYGAVAREAARLASARSRQTLERLCEDLVDQLLERFEADSVTVRAAKRRPSMELEVEEVAVQLTGTR